MRITELTDGVFYAVLAFDGGVEVSARPSDAIALALRTGTAIHCAEAVLDEAGIAVPDEQEDEVEKFREFLDQISPGRLPRRDDGPRARNDRVVKSQPPPEGSHPSGRRTACRTPQR